MVCQDKSLKLLISRYKQKVFALVLCLIGGDQDITYDVAASSFAEAIRRRLSPENEDIFLARVVSIAIKNSRSIKTIPTFAHIDMRNLPAEEKKSLRVIQTALQALPFDARALLLLRDQLHFSCKDISAIIDIPENNVRVRIEQVRSSLRRKIEEILNCEG